MLDFVVHGEGCVYPVDVVSVFFHSSEPGHLAFGELVNGGVESLIHLLVVELSGEVLDDEFVFKAVVFYLFGGESLVKECFDFADHALVESLLESLGDALSAELAVEGDSDEEGVDWGVFFVSDLVGGVVFFDFYGPDESFAGVGVGVVVECFEGGQMFDEGLVGLLFKGCSEGGVGWYADEAVAFDGGLEV